MTRLTKRYRFAASHRLHAPSLSGEENRELYGKCNNPYGHGHDFILEVRVKGDVDPASGLVVDQRKLDTLVHNAVLRDFHMKYLNAQVPAFANVVPTSENVAIEARRRLCDAWQETFGSRGPALDAVRVIETKKNVFES
ncbi:MAG TPA: 6-carboxytetrahydropterin synthase [Bryobacteraceae bacterium]|nr:6-carboxytetrahydropterin synthase [Bryobacteraceae bacterium]